MHRMTDDEAAAPAAKFVQPNLPQHPHSLLATASSTAAAGPTDSICLRPCTCNQNFYEYLIKTNECILCVRCAGRTAGGASIIISRRRNSRHRRRPGYEEFRRKPRRASAGGGRVDRFWLFHVTKQFWPNERERDPSEMSVCSQKHDMVCCTLGFFSLLASREHLVTGTVYGQNASAKGREHGEEDDEKSV